MNITVEGSAKMTRAVIESLSVEDIRELAAKKGYELRKKGEKREKVQVLSAVSGEPLRNCFAPHLRITATALARTWKMLRLARKVFHMGQLPYGVIWERVLLLALEHIVRWLKHEIDDAEMQKSIRRLVSPLPKAEYIRNNNKKGNK